MTDLTLLAAQLDDIARSVPGVSALYSTRPAIVTSLRQVAAGPEATSLVDVRSTDEGVSIVASIGVTSEIQGPRTAAAVSAALLDALPDGLHGAVHVRISRVEIRAND